MLKVADRVRETTNAAGTGNILLQGALGGYRTAASAFTTGDQIPYVISKGNDYEIGEGTLTSGTPWSLSRDVIKSSSNNNEKINVTLGMIVFVDATKSYLDSFKSDVAASVSETVTACVTENITPSLSEIVTSITSTLSLTSSYENYYSHRHNQFGHVIRKRTYGVGGTATNLIFDGVYIWVANGGGSTLSKINTMDAVGSPTTFNVGSNPHGLVFTGSHIWVGNYGGDTIQKINVDTLTINATFTIADTENMTFDGTNIWAATATNSITKINSTTGSITTISATGIIFDVYFDGTYVWASDIGSAKLYKIDTLTDTIIGEIITNSGITQMCFDGSYLWCSDSARDKLIKIDTNLNSVVATITLPDSGVGGLGFDGNYLWVSNSYLNTISKFNTTDGTVYATISVGTYPTRMTFDGFFMWCIMINDNKVMKLNKYVVD